MKRKYLLLIIFIFFTLIGCTHKTPYTDRGQFIMISQEEELALGEQSYEKALSESKVITNTSDARKVKEIGERIAKVTDVTNFDWEFNLVENSAKNAYCLPGGKVVVYTGILEIIENDDQLATVIAHEIAHALARHGAERMSTTMLAQGVQTIGTIILGVQGSRYTEAFNIAFGVGSQVGILLPYGRLQETEADEIGIYLMQKAGYDVNQAVKFWENMSHGHKETVEFLSTHPSSDTRIEDINKIIKNLE